MKYFCDKCGNVFFQEVENCHHCDDSNIIPFEENNPGFWTPENEDDSITGRLINIQEDVGTNKSMLYTIEADNTPTNIWGSAILDQRMIGIKVGDLIRITYKGLGEKASGKNPPKIFKVEYDRE